MLTKSKGIFLTQGQTHCWPNSDVLFILMCSDRLQLPGDDKKLGRLKVNGIGGLMTKGDP